jgi:hypothetical protein
VPCTADEYTNALSREAVCVEARDVAPERSAPALKEPAKYLDQVPAALALLAQKASSDDQLDLGFRTQFVQALDRSLSREGAKPVTFFDVDGKEISGCGCAHVIGTLGTTPVCLRLPADSAQTNACTLASFHVVPFEATPDGVKRAVRHEAYVDLALKGLQALNAAGRRQAHHGVAESLRSWKRYRRGPFQLPWELAFNGWLERKYPSTRACPTGTELGPCHVQYIAAHPLAALGVQLNNIGEPGKVERQATATLAVEALGVIAYNKEFRHYFGAALAVGFDNLVFEDPRLGLTLHLTRFVNLGYLVSVRDESTGDCTVLLAGDLASWARDLATD